MSWSAICMLYDKLLTIEFFFHENPNGDCGTKPLIFICIFDWLVDRCIALLWYSMFMWWDKGPPHLCYFYFCHLIIVSQWATLYWQLSDISFDIHVLYFIVLFLMSMFVLAAKLLFIDSYYFLLVQLLNDLYQQSLFVCSCSKRAQGSAIKHQQGINNIIVNNVIHVKDRSHGDHVLATVVVKS